MRGPLDDLYFSLPVSLDGLPQTVRALGERWQRARRLHVSVFSPDRLAPIIGRQLGLPEDKTCQRLARARPLVLEARLRVVGELGPLRVARRGDRASLLAMVNVIGLDGLYRRLSQQVGCALPCPPAHVTLYTLPGRKGIGLASQEELELASRALTAAEVQQLRGQGVRLPELQPAAG